MFKVTRRHHKPTAYKPSAFPKGSFFRPAEPSGDRNDLFIVTLQNSVVRLADGMVFSMGDFGTAYVQVSVEEVVVSDV